ncbi:hypothetical protein, partial [Thiolapillus sp.]|uniref:hypothetical protein n=1 Tax=Thiolapillus sp. TaxID=2017437 RepID=UPI003AF490E5
MTNVGSGGAHHGDSIVDAQHRKGVGKTAHLSVGLQPVVQFGNLGRFIQGEKHQPQHDRCQHGGIDSGSPVEFRHQSRKFLNCSG